MIILIYLIGNSSNCFYYTVMQSKGNITMFPVQQSLRSNVLPTYQKYFFHLQGRGVGTHLSNNMASLPTIN